jgi:hypothetical protein
VDFNNSSRDILTFFSLLGKSHLQQKLMVIIVRLIDGLCRNLTSYSGIKCDITCVEQLQQGSPGEWRRRQVKMTGKELLGTTLSLPLHTANLGHIRKE